MTVYTGSHSMLFQPLKIADGKITLEQWHAWCPRDLHSGASFWVEEGRGCRARERRLYILPAVACRAGYYSPNDWLTDNLPLCISLG